MMIDNRAEHETMQPKAKAMFLRAEIGIHLCQYNMRDIINDWVIQ